MRRTEILQENRKMRFEEAYWRMAEEEIKPRRSSGDIGVCSRTFRRYIVGYKENGQEGLNDKRLSQASHRRAPVDEGMALGERYSSRYRGWNVKHFYSWYSREGEKRSYTWVKNTLQRQGLVLKTSKKGSHRQRRK